MLRLRTFCTMSIYDPNNQDVSKCVDFHCQNVLSRKNTKLQSFGDNWPSIFESIAVWKMREYGETS